MCLETNSGAWLPKESVRHRERTWKIPGGGLGWILVLVGLLEVAQVAQTKARCSGEDTYCDIGLARNSAQKICFFTAGN